MVQPRVHAARIAVPEGTSAHPGNDRDGRCRRGPARVPKTGERPRLCTVWPPSWVTRSVGSRHRVRGKFAPISWRTRAHDRGSLGTGVRSREVGPKCPASSGFPPGRRGDNPAMVNVPDVQAVCGQFERRDIAHGRFVEECTRLIAAAIGCSRAGTWLFEDAAEGRLLRCLGIAARAVSRSAGTRAARRLSRGSCEALR